VFSGFSGISFLSIKIHQQIKNEKIKKPKFFEFHFDFILVIFKGLGFGYFLIF